MKEIARKRFPAARFGFAGGGVTCHWRAESSYSWSRITDSREKRGYRMRKRREKRKAIIVPYVSSITSIVLEGLGFLCPGFCRNPHAPQRLFLFNIGMLTWLSVG